MILVQSVVVAEALRREPNPEVIRWFDAQLHETLYLAATCAAALLRDASLEPKSRRVLADGTTLLSKVFTLFEDRILPFDGRAMVAYEQIMENVWHEQRSINRRDALTAAIAKANGMTVACRNQSPFLAAGLNVRFVWGL